MNVEENSLWLIGAGPMSVDYARVLDALVVGYSVVGRSKRSALTFKEVTGKTVQAGGVSSAIESSTAPETAIVSVGIEQLARTAGLLIDAGTKRILLEKPGGLNSGELRGLCSRAQKRGVIVMIAYNRRFYASTLKALELIRSDGGVTSCCFECTEWSNQIGPLKKAPGIKETWFLGNSTHVADLAFFLSGTPMEWQGWHEGSLEWHPASARFCGAGRTDRGALFSYHADWESPGRWGIEVCTRRRRLVFRPMEQLHETLIGSVTVNPVDIDDSLDREFKPGLYRQTEAFLNGNYGSFCNLPRQAELCSIYEKMAGYID